MSTIAERTNLPKVLLIEDSSGDATLMKLAFKRSAMPTHVAVATSAEMGMAMLRQEGDYTTSALPDIILMDLNLPKMRGLEFLSRVKADPALRILPIVVLSSSETASDLAAAYNDYANGFVVKPISLDDYDNVVQIIEDYWFNLVQTLPHAEAGL
jgi:CheY-like chemotaxis protein